MNKLVVIGYIGIKRCYLNIDEKDAISRYIQSEGISEKLFVDNDIQVDVIEFDDEFGAYAVWEN